ncbi:MAG: hypothetical protein WBA12_06320 [Catalinimonas sp.]
MWAQYAIIICLVLTAGLYLGRLLYRQFRPKPGGGCAKGCGCADAPAPRPRPS